MPTELEILKLIWTNVNACEDIPFSDKAYLNEDNLSMVLLDELVIIYVKGDKVILSYSAEMYHPLHIITVYNFLYNFLGSILEIGECFYIEYDEEGKHSKFHIGDDAQRLALKDRCFNVFKDLMNSRNMLDYLEALNIDDMIKC